MLRSIVVFLLATGIASAGLIGLPTLSPGTTLANVDDLSVADRNGTSPLGSIFLDTGVQNFSFTGSGITTSGQVREVVFRETTGTLDFLIGVNVTAGALSEVSQVNTGNFVGFTTRVGTISLIQLLGAAGSFQPTTVSRTSGGDTIDWNYNTNLTGGQAAVAVISTDAFNAIPSNVGLIGAGGGTQTVAGFEPTNVPEPTSFVLMGGGLVVAGLLRRRRSKKL
jgi:hypothetical protein